MKQRLRYIIIFWVMTFLSARLLVQCIDPIEIDIPEQEPLLIVDGLISDQAGPYTVKLSNSNPLNQQGFNPVVGAQISIEEEGGAKVPLSEVDAGIYQTDSASISGKAGKRYRIEIALSPDRNYQSNWIMLKAAPAIGNIYYEFDFLPEAEIPVRGARIFLDTQDPENKTQFYRWEWEDTWMHIAPFASGLIFVGNDSTADVEAKAVCYNNSRSHSILLATSVNNSEDVISKYPISTVSAFGSQLRYRYSLLVKQYALNEEEYLFWKKLKEANEESGGLYERQPQSTTGNITRIENPDEPVLGYFSVSGYSEKRIFIERDDLPRDAIVGEQYIQDCFVKSDTLYKGLQSETDVFEALSTGSVFFNFLRDPDIVGWIIATPDCADCTESGGTTIKPDFW